MSVVHGLNNSLGPRSTRRAHEGLLDRVLMSLPENALMTAHVAQLMRSASSAVPVLSVSQSVMAYTRSCAGAH